MKTHTKKIEAVGRALVAAWWLASGCPAQQPPDWLLVRGEAESITTRNGPFAWTRLAEAYLRRNYRIVGSDEAGAAPAASRLVVGTPSGNPLARRLAAELGVTFGDGQLGYGGRTFAGEAGVAIVTDDPDGEGTLVLFTGGSEQAVGNCLSVPVDLARHGVVVMTWQRALHRGAVDSRPLQVAAERLRVVRLDRQLFAIRRALADAPDEAALHISRACAGYQDVFDRCFGGKVDLREHFRGLLRRRGPQLDATEQRFADVDLERLLDELDVEVGKALGGRTGPRPLVHVVAIGPGTNAQVIDADPVTGRPRMTLNLSRFDDVGALRLAVVHELVHTLQTAHGGTLLGRAMHEGVASYVSQQLVPGTTEHEALMWTRAELEQATKHRRAIVAAFTEHRHSRDARMIGQFLYADVPLRLVAGAPARTGYFVGMQAAAAWCRADRERTLADLLRASAEDLFAAR